MVYFNLSFQDGHSPAQREVRPGTQSGTMEEDADWFSTGYAYLAFFYSSQPLDQRMTPPTMD